MLHSLKNIYKNGGFQRADTWNLVSGNHLRSRKNGSASASKFRKGDATALDELVFYNMLIPNPFFLKTVDNFNTSPQFGLYDIFNNLICSPELITGSALRFKRALTTAYSSFDFPVLMRRRSWKLELLSATPLATLTHLSCSPNFPRASYLDERTLMYEPIVK